MKSQPYRRTIPVMDTLVTIEIPGRVRKEKRVESAFEWFRYIEARCSRFDPQSELAQLSLHIGETVTPSALLFEAVRFSIAVAQETGGAFDPTVGRTMESRGFNRNYQTGEALERKVPSDVPATFRDVIIDPENKTITLLRPMVLDLGAVAKGLAIDMAARDLEEFRNFAINAGGDLFLSGSNAAGEPWSVGIRNPNEPDQLIETVRVSNKAVCTSGNYERDRHILDPRSGSPASEVASVTVVAPTAMLADALATAAFVLGPSDGIALLERMEVNGLIFTPQLERFATRGFLN